MNKKNEIDMLHGSLVDKILTVALPLAAISILQQLFNAADVAVVGRFASDNALAAVGANTPIINMFITFFTGLATGGNVAISIMIGRGEREKVNRGIQSIYTLSLICVVILLAAGELLAAPILHWVNTPENVLDKAVLYLRIYLFAMVFAVIYNFMAAILRSKGDTKRPLYCLIASGIINVILNLIFVIGFHMDVAGVAIATLIANIVNAGAVIIILMHESGEFQLDISRLTIDPEVIRFALRIGLPAGLQGFLFSASNIIIQSGINSFGADCIAGNTAAMNFEFMVFFIVNAFGQTATTFTSQNYGAGEYDRCKKVYRYCMILETAIAGVVSLIFYFGADFWLGFFTTSPAVIEYAMVRMTLVVLLEFTTGFNDTAACSLRGLGISLQPTIISIMGTCVLRIIWVATIFRWYHNIYILMAVYPISWVLLSVPMMTTYFVMRKRLFAD